MKSVRNGVAEIPVRRFVVSMPSRYHLFSAADAPSIETPPLRLSALAPGAMVTRDVKSRPFGRRSIASARRFVAAVDCFTSIVGDSAVTCTLSATPATCSARSTLSSLPTSTITGALFAVTKPCIMPLRHEAAHVRRVIRRPACGSRIPIPAGTPSISQLPRMARSLVSSAIAVIRSSLSL